MPLSRKSMVQNSNFAAVSNRPIRAQGIARPFIWSHRFELLNSSTNPQTLIKRVNELSAALRRKMKSNAAIVGITRDPMEGIFTPANDRG
jgi:hypothetical protein